MIETTITTYTNQTNSDSYSCYIKCDAFKFIGEQQYAWNFKFYLNYITFKYHTHKHTYTHYKIFTM